MNDLSASGKGLACRTAKASDAGVDSGALTAEASLHIPLGTGLLITPGLVLEHQAGAQALSVAAKLQWRF